MFSGLTLYIEPGGAIGIVLVSSGFRIATSGSRIRIDGVVAVSLAHPARVRTKKSQQYGHGVLLADYLAGFFTGFTG